MSTNSPNIKQNKVAGPTLEYNEIVPTETVYSPNPKDRRRHNDDSKTEEKIRREKAKYQRQRAAVEMLRHSPKMNPWNYGQDLDNLPNDYAPHSKKFVQNIPMPDPYSSTPYENLSPLHNHLEPLKHD